MNGKQFGQSLGVAFKAAKIKQGDISTRTGIEYKFLNKFLNGVQSVSLDNALIIAECYPQIFKGVLDDIN